MGRKKRKSVCDGCTIKDQYATTEWIYCQEIGTIRHMWYLNCRQAKRIKGYMIKSKKKAKEDNNYTNE